MAGRAGGHDQDVDPRAQRPRAHRLLELAALLRERSPAAVGVAELADLLEVSVATVRRDLADLARNGLPVRRAVGGRWALEPHGADPVRADGAASVAAPVALTVAEAVHARRVVRIVYAAADGSRTVRDVDPAGLVVAPGAEYLAGYCRLRDAPRLFRLDRVLAALLTGDPAADLPLRDVLAVVRVPPPRGPVE